LLQINNIQSSRGLFYTVQSIIFKPNAAILSVYFFFLPSLPGFGTTSGFSAASFSRLALIPINRASVRAYANIETSEDKAHILYME
jgi:hypothetical protein